jgi:hypothetical protein
VRRQNSQGLWAPGGATLRLPPRMCLARSERERLWKGLERFVNCGDSEGDYQALGRAFPEFWPLEIWHYPFQESKDTESLCIPTIGASSLSSDGGEFDHEIEESIRLGEIAKLDWHKVCHKLFGFYRDALRDVWSGKEETIWLGGGREEFLLGLSNLNEEAYEAAKKDSDLETLLSVPYGLYLSWREIVQRFSTATAEGELQLRMLWNHGEFYLVPRNDFQRAFYLLFRQSWSARVCPRCKLFFVARRPKQAFCGTACSAGSRLASKRKWWRSVGTKNRKKAGQVHRLRGKVKGAN